ncbi:MULTISPECIES: pyroglutamyl-peptidase I family protein [Pacificimonas]|uniref:Pyrrolidone-carboxylate peptidase n=1 Tax=Pacificimonas aurantium TaxID=1250540 RepID=A0ABS7WMX2_9SPHN|nr:MULTISPECIES: hypothetical protein [Pacificimonas]MBZ6379749.1 hypothetical protein [Pacificimonas aurantium]
MTVTAFRDFLHVRGNPSEALLTALQMQTPEANEGWAFRLLDTVYADVEANLLAVLSDPPDLLLMTGYSAQARGLKLETGASDLMSPKFADAAGHVPGPAAGTGTRIENERIDFAALRARLGEAGVAHHASGDAGEFVCNHLYYRALRLIARQDAATTALFVHVPAIAGTTLEESSASAMTLEEMVRGVRAVAAALSTASAM